MIINGDNISANVNNKIDVNNPVNLADGTAALPSLSFTNDSDTGLYRIDANKIGISVGGNKVLELDPNTFSTFQGGVERFRIEATGQIKATYESTVGSDYNTTLHNGYLCRTWCNFNGTGTVAIRASGNVSSITDGGTGIYTLNFLTNLPDADYSIATSINNEDSATNPSFWYVVNIPSNAIGGTITNSQLKIITGFGRNDNNFSEYDPTYIGVSIFR